MSQVAPQLVFEVLAEHKIVVLCHGPDDASAQEWTRWVELVRSIRDDHTRYLVYSTGGRPNRAQQAEISEVVRGRAHRVAVISPSTAASFMVSVFALVTPGIRLYTPTQFDKALGFLECTPVEAAAIRGAIDRMQAQLNS